MFYRFPLLSGLSLFLFHITRLALPVSRLSQPTFSHRLPTSSIACKSAYIGFLPPLPLTSPTLYINTIYNIYNGGPWRLQLSSSQSTTTLEDPHLLDTNTTKKQLQPRGTQSTTSQTSSPPSSIWDAEATTKHQRLLPPLPPPLYHQHITHHQHSTSKVSIMTATHTTKHHHRPRPASRTLRKLRVERWRV